MTIYNCLLVLRGPSDIEIMRKSMHYVGGCDRSEAWNDFGGLVEHKSTLIEGTDDI